MHRFAEELLDLMRLQGAKPHGVPMRRLMACPAHSPLDLEIEAQIRMRNGKTARQSAQSVVHGPRNQAGIPLRLFQSAKRVVSGKQLIATIAAQGHGDLPPREAAQQPSRQQGIVTLGLVKLAEDFRQHVTCLVKVESFALVICSEKLSRSSGLSGFVESSAR